MNNLSIILNSSEIELIIYILKTFLISICTYYTFLKLINVKDFLNIKLILIFIFDALISTVCGIVKYSNISFPSIICLILLLSILHSLTLKRKFGNSILITTFSLSINYAIFFIDIFINFLLNIILIMPNDYINLFIMSVTHIIFIKLLFRIKRFSNGLSFLKKNLENDYFDVLILTISVTVLFTFFIFSNFNIEYLRSSVPYFIIFTFIAFITTQKTLTIYYKHKLLITELNDTKDELVKKNKEITDLEAEILEYSKIAHSITHKQKSLEHKLNKLMFETETGAELDIRDRLNDISNEYSKNIATTPLPKTDIEIIDDMLSYMQSECKENNIDFELQLNGNVHHMINTYITKEDLEILLADHIKDAIIAINYSNNINKSILVKLGLLDGNYLLSIYDSGIEFEIDTLLNLGLQPSTTHSNDGGTGMGFMNTFDTLRKYNASLYINEITTPNKDNYTKSVTISFNNKNEYKVASYRANEIKEKNKRNDLLVE